MCPDILQSTSHGEEQEQAEMGHPRRETERPCSPGALVATLLTPQGCTAAAACRDAFARARGVSPMCPDKSVTHVPGCTEEPSASPETPVCEIAHVLPRSPRPGEVLVHTRGLQDYRPGNVWLCGGDTSCWLCGSTKPLPL